MDVRASFERIRLRSEQLGRRVQGVVVRVLLTLLYVFGIGATWLLAHVFARHILKMYQADPQAPSTWLEAVGYDPDPQSLTRQF